MIKRSLLATAIAALSAQAVNAAPFMPMDARGLAMGNTGVASAKRAHAPAYNPSLLSQASEDDDFALLLPLGVSFADEEEMIDTAQDVADDIVPALEDLFEDNNATNFTGLLDATESAANALESALQTPANQAAIATANTNFGTALNNLNEKLNEVNSVTSELDSALNSISGNPLSARLGLSTALAIPSKKFAAALSLSGTVTGSGRVLFSGNDSNLLNAYGDAAGDYISSAQQLQSGVSDALDETDLVAQATAFNNLESAANALQNFNSDQVTTASGDIRIIENGAVSPDAEDADMDSQLEIVAVGVVDLGLSFSREFNIGGEAIAIGITPKLQKIITYHYADEVDGFDDVDADDLEDYKEEYSNFNLDIGASWRFGDNKNWMLGLVAKNLVSDEFEYADVIVTPTDTNGNITGAPYIIKGGKVSLDPQYRAGVAYNGSWVSAAIDVDLVENDPVAYESATQFASFGAEFDIFETLQLRAGYRTNMSSSGSDIASLGIGFSPFGVHIDIAAMANIDDPESEAGAALEIGFYF